MSLEFAELGNAITKTETPTVTSWEASAIQPLAVRPNSHTTALGAARARDTGVPSEQNRLDSSPAPIVNSVDGQAQDATLVRNAKDYETATKNGEALQAVEKLLQSKAPVSEPSSLWQAVREHPGKTALAVGGAALAVGLAKYGMTRYANAQLPRVLIVEESPFMGQAIKSALVKNGYQADLILGARSLKNFVGIATDGTDVAIDLSRYRFGVLAGGLKGKYHGTEIAQRLSSEKMTTIGLSTSDEMGATFRLNGATITTNKATGFAALHQRVIDPVSAIKAPQKTQAALDKFGIELQANRELRRSSDEVLMEAMKKFGLGD